MEVVFFKYILSENDNVIEVGSNIGMHAVPIAKTISAGKLFCFEPQRIIFQRLCCNLALNDLTNVYAYHQGVSNESQQVEIESSDYKTPWNYGSFSIDKGFSTEGQFDGKVTKENISLITLDEHSEIQKLSSIKLLKIDAEGFDLNVLAGAKNLLAKHKPVIFIEVHFESFMQTKAYLETLDYVCYWYNSDRYQPNNFFQQENIDDGPRIDMNFVCYHRDTLDVNNIPFNLMAVTGEERTGFPLMHYT
ncbi:hypothetical protein A4G18_07265 [Pasteurellaceae bacterium Pebbles2]|nr:hypothetical protein [Pasteurellaceae bacterium Pebbles2]